MNQWIALLRREWIIRRRDLFIYGLVIVIVLLGNEVFRSLLARWEGASFAISMYVNLFPSFLFIGGFITTATLFNADLYRKDNQHTYLMIPASGAHKFLSKTLLALVGYPLALTALFILASVIIEPLLLLVFQNPLSFYVPLLQSYHWQLVLRYMVANTLVILGSTLFRKAPLVKTVLAFTIVVLSLMALGLFFVRVFIAIKGGGGLPFFETLSRFDSRSLDSSISAYRLWKVGSSLLNYLIIPLLCLIAAYYRFTEVEATDAVQ